MRRTSDEVIKDYISRGYYLVLKSKDANEIESLRVHYKSNGFDARWWALKDESGSYCVLYAKQRAPRKKAVFTTNPITDQTYYHGFQEEKEDYSGYNVKQLKDVCKKMNIKGYSKMNKDEMIAALTA